MFMYDTITPVATMDHPRIDLITDERETIDRQNDPNIVDYP